MPMDLMDGLTGNDVGVEQHPAEVDRSHHELDADDSSDDDGEPPYLADDMGHTDHDSEADHSTTSSSGSRHRRGGTRSQARQRKGKGRGRVGRDRRW